MYIYPVSKHLCLHDYLLQGQFFLLAHLSLTISITSNALASLFTRRLHFCCSQYPFHLQNHLQLIHSLYSTPVFIFWLNFPHQHQIYSLFLYIQCLLSFFLFHLHLFYEDNLNEALSTTQEFLYWNFQEPWLNPKHISIHFQLWK